MRQLILVSCLSAVIAVAGAAWWIYGDMQRALNRPMQLDTVQTLEVRPGMSLRSISRELAQRGWIDHPLYLVMEGRRQGTARSIKAGEFSVQPGTTPLQLLDQLVSGKVIHYALTIVEGWNYRQIIRAVRDSTDLVQTLQSYEPGYVMAAIGYAGYFAEGRFYPDTYHFPAGTTDVDFLRRAVKTMEDVLHGSWAHRDTGLPYASPYEALIMASLVEKETAVASERARIAGVLVRRLERGIKLQVDPTVIYAMGEAYDGNIRRRDLSLDSPFNTYVSKGLPPTPIASPGRESIEAALHPEPGEYLYFVAKGDGTHHFSKTLREHNRAVAKYQLKNR